MAGLLPGETWRGPTNQSARWGLALILPAPALVLFPSWRGQGIIISLRNYLKEGLGAVLYMPCHSSMPPHAIMGILQWASRAEGGGIEFHASHPSISYVCVCRPLGAANGKSKEQQAFPSVSRGLSQPCRYVQGYSDISCLLARDGD